MDIFEQAVNVMRYISNGSAETNAFFSWKDSFCREQINECFENIKQTSPYNTEQFWRDVFSLSEDQKRVLGFQKFDEHDTDMCIPIWVWQCLPDNMLIEGRPKKDLDNDIRFGCVWWKA